MFRAFGRRLSVFGGGAGKSVLVAVLLSCLAVPAQALVVKRDMGGSVSSRIEQVRVLAAEGTEVRIVGTCISACTLFLGVPGACVSTKARLGFHGPSTRFKGVPLPREDFERISQQMAAHYPEPLRNWFLAKARYQTGDYVVITGRQAIAMGARACA